MHSIREMCGTDDVNHTVNLFKVYVLSSAMLTCWQSFFSNFVAIDKKVSCD